MATSALKTEAASVIASSLSSAMHSAADNLDVWASYSGEKSPKVTVESATVTLESGIYDVEFEVTVKVIALYESDEDD